MKRSEINAAIARAKALFAEYRFALPPFAHWTPDDWQSVGREADEIRSRGLGWDITDFASGDFQRVGLTLVTLRNGVLDDPDNAKPYAEKIMLVEENQVTPWHFHSSKTEDIINRGGGNLVCELKNSNDDESFAASPVAVSCDGVARQVPAGGKVILTPGESITLVPRLYHTFYGQEGCGPVVVGEVSTINDDTTDNRFNPPLARYPAIDEDEPPAVLLCTEYPRA